MAKNFILIFALFFFGSTVAVEIVPLFASKSDADISSPERKEGVVSKPVFYQASRLRQLNGKTLARVVQGGEGQFALVHSLAVRISRSSSFFPWQDLYKLQGVYRR